MEDKKLGYLDWTTHWTGPPPQQILNIQDSRIQILHCLFRELALHIAVIAPGFNLGGLNKDGQQKKVDHYAALPVEGGRGTGR